MRAENSCEPAGTFAIEYRPSGFVRVPMLSVLDEDLGARDRLAVGRVDHGAVDYAGGLS